MEKEPSKSFLDDWKSLSPKLKLVALVLVIVPVYLYPPSAILFLSYVAILNIRGNRKK
ncbi:MAG: hypothetical protein RL201_565 [Actinomycetota bacterium]|jgi:hypothetical protein